MTDHAYVAQLRAVIADFQHKLEMATQNPSSQSDLPAILLLLMSSTAGATTYFTITKLATVSAAGVDDEFFSASILARDLIALLSHLNVEFKLLLPDLALKNLGEALVHSTIAAIQPPGDAPRIEQQADGTRIVTDFISDGAVASDGRNVG